MANEACAVVKTDLGVGPWTNFGGIGPIIYNTGIEDFEGGNDYIKLRDGIRNPLQLVNGPVLLNSGSCILEAHGANQDNVDNLYLDIIAILTATNRGYTFKRGRDAPMGKTLFTITMEVSYLQ
jgi:hypothetical protein